ncbi:MAG: M16 family metallopeptidase [Bacteroidales bacterium]
MTLKIDRRKGVEPKMLDNFSMVKPTIYHLDNGIPVYEVSGGSQEVVRIEVVIDAGSYYQSVAGQAMLMTRMMVEGTQKYSGKDISDITEFYGSFISNSPEKDFVSFSVTALNKHLEKLLPVLEEVICCPTFPDAERQKLINAQKHDLAVDRQKVQTRSFFEFQELIYGKKCPYRSITKEIEFDLLTPELIKDFYETQVGPKAVKIFVAGLPEKNLSTLLNKHLGGKWGASKLKTQDNFIVDSAKAGRHDIVIPGAIQSGIMLGYPIISRNHPDYHFLEITNMVFGGYFNSRLMSNIREDKGYTYGIHSHFVSVLHTSFFYISTEVNSQFTEPTLNEIYKEIDILRQDKISVEELNQVRTNLLGGFIRSLDGPLLQGGKVRTMVDYQLGEDYYQKYLDAILSVTPDDILNTAQKYFGNEKFIEVVVRG